jgi:PAS domain S-box-containing protein
MQGVVQDITDLRSAKIVFSSGLNEFRQIFENTPLGMRIIDENFNVLRVNASFVELSGGSIYDTWGMKCYETFSSPLCRTPRCPLARVFAGDSRVDFEADNLRLDGGVIPCHTTASPLRSPEGELLGIVEVFADISERRRTEKSLKQLVAQLARSNQELEEFAHIASHDLREPLRGIRNYCDILREDYGDKLDAEAREKLDTLPRLSSRMEDLIESLLFYSRVGRVDLAFETTDLNEVVDEVLERLGHARQEGAVEILIPAPLPAVKCDRVRVAEVFSNLISNAIKYNDKREKWIEIGCLAPPRGRGGKPAESVFYVRDNGIGIAEKHFPAIFRIFKRLQARDKFGGGTGAGLTIAKKIVERHGGRIWLESAPGAGTTFYFTLQGEN